MQPNEVCLVGSDGYPECRVIRSPNEAPVPARGFVLVYGPNNTPRQIPITNDQRWRKYGICGMHAEDFDCFVEYYTTYPTVH
jgi:hypothetical protein